MTNSLLQCHSIGTHGLRAAPIGLGCMGMSDMNGTAQRRDDAESIAKLQAAVDTGDFYGMGHNELLVGKRAPSRAVGRSPSA